MVKRMFILLLCACSFAAGMSAPGSCADLNGYTFGDDSAEIWKNPYFSNYSHIASLGFKLYGYGDFSGATFSQQYQQDTAAAGIACVDIYELTYYPTYSSATSTFQMDLCSGLMTYAKDTEDNIHVLGITVFLNDQTISWDYEDLAEGETTLKYPAEPFPGQQVFRGQVVATGVGVGSIPNCVALSFDSLPQFPSRTITEYLQPGAGMVAAAYNWEGRLNGYSFDAVAPEAAEDEKSGWAKWRDDHCFISACAPGQGRGGKGGETLIRVFLRISASIRGFLFS